MTILTQPPATFAHLDSTTSERKLKHNGIYPAVDPWHQAHVPFLQIVGEEHYAVATEVQRVLQHYRGARYYRYPWYG